jgi:tetratricopeptide (TPR) repeat protein
MRSTGTSSASTSTCGSCPCLERIAQLESTTADVPVPGMSRFGFLELALALEDAQLASEHAGHLVTLGKKHDTPYLSTFVNGYRGMAALLAQEHGEALTSLVAALSMLRKTGAATEFETEVLASIAECHLRMGDFDEAHSYATEAVTLAEPRSNRIAECRARIARGAAALALGGGRGDGAQADFERAQSLIETTGAVACVASLARARQSVSVARAA